MRWQAVILGILLVAVSSIAEAQMPVEVVSSGQDPVGQRLVYFFKDAIRRSSTFTLSLEENLGFRVSIVTLDPEQRRTAEGYWTVYSATWTWNNPEQPFPFYLQQVVGTCGSNRVRECADSLLVVTNDQLERVARLIRRALSR
jgi:hypothetical protein